MSNPILRPAARPSYVGGVLGAAFLVIVFTAYAWPAIFAALPANSFSVLGVTLYQLLFDAGVVALALIGFSYGSKLLH